MDFQYFLQIVLHLDSVKVSGEEAHKIMAPEERIKIMENLASEELNPKNAGVLMLLYPKGGIMHLVLIVRNSYEGVHSSQIAFPGGKFEPEDVNFERTALRETFEEIGVDSNKIEVLKSFTRLYIPPSNFMVYPFLGICREEINFYPDTIEVAEIIELPLATLLSDTIVSDEIINTSYSKSIAVPVFKINNHIVWGATAMILSELKMVLIAAISELEV